MWAGPRTPGTKNQWPGTSPGLGGETEWEPRPQAPGSYTMVSRNFKAQFKDKIIKNFTQHSIKSQAEGPYATVVVTCLILSHAEASLDKFILFQPGVYGFHVTSAPS